MPGFNRVILLGNLTRTPEVRYTQAGTSVTEVGLAVGERRKGDDGRWQEETTFIDVTLWGRTAEVAGEFLRKGSSVLIEGRLQLDSWTDREGQKRSKLKVIGERLQMLGGARGRKREETGGQGVETPSTGDDVPY